MAYITRNRKDTESVSKSYDDADVTEHTDSQTIIRIASSLERAGESGQAISLLEKALENRVEDGPLYLALADVYKSQGNLAKAAELEREARTFAESKLN